MFKNTLVVTSFLIFSAALGFLSQIIFASTFGASVEMDIYFKILSVPAILTGISPIIFSSVLIPAFAKFKSDKFGLNKFTDSMWIFIFVFGLFFILIGFVFSTLNIDLFIPENSADLKHIAVQVALLVWIGSGLMIMSSFLTAILNYKKQFFKVAWTSILPSFCMIIAVFLLHEFIGVRTIALGFCIALLIQFLIFFNASKISFNFSSFNVKHIQNKKQLLEQSLLVTLSLLPFTILAPIAYFWASQLEIGSISYIGYSQNFAGFLSVAVSMGISMVSFPELADRFANQNGDSSLHNFEKSLKYVMLIAMFAAGLLIILRMPILSLFYQRGSFDASAVNNLSSILSWYLAAAVFTGGLNFLRTLFYSKGEFKKIAFFGLAIPLVFFVLSGILKEKFSLVGIGIANLITLAILFFISVYIAKNKELKFLTNSFYFFLLKNILSILTTYFFVRIIMSFIGNNLSQLPTIIICIFLFLFAYLFSSRNLFRIKEIEDIIFLFMNKLKSFIK